MNPFDLALFSSLNHFARLSPPLDDLLIFFSDNFGYLLLAALVLAIFFVKKPSPKEFLFSLILTFGSALTSRFLAGSLIRFFWNRPRPFEVLSNVHQLIAHSAGRAFPSGHALFYFGIAGALFFIDRRLAVLATLGAFLIGVARVASGIHWPTDMLGGMVMGIFTGFAIGFLGKRLMKKLEPTAKGESHS